MSGLDFEVDMCKAATVDATKEEEIHHPFGVIRYFGDLTPAIFLYFVSQHPSVSITFLDGLHAIPNLISSYGHTIVFASPSFEGSEDKNIAWKVSKAYMPVWSKEEMQSYKDVTQQDPFRGRNLDDLYESFSGCIGFGTSSDIEKASKELYNTAIVKHVFQHRNNLGAAKNPKLAKPAQLVEIYTIGHTIASRWLMTRVSNQIEYMWTLGQATNFYYASKNPANMLVMNGYWFEELVSQSWILEKGLLVDVLTWMTGGNQVVIQKKLLP